MLVHKIAVLLFVIFNFGEHDTKISHFDIVKEKYRLHLNIELDRTMFEQSFTKKSTVKYLDNSERDLLIKTYVNDHFAIIVNKEQLQIGSFSVSADHHHFNIKIRYEEKLHSIENIEIKNTFMIAEYHDYINIVRAKINNVVRGFKMTKNRQSIRFSY